VSTTLLAGLRGIAQAMEDSITKLVINLGQVCKHIHRYLAMRCLCTVLGQSPEVPLGKRLSPIP